MSNLRIVAVACRLGDLVVSMPPPARHHVVLHELHDAGLTKHVEPGEQGFLLSDGSFVNRREAFLVASAAGQRLPRPAGGYDGPELFSEDVW